MANRFDQVAAPARFSPLTFEEQSFAPLALRAREDGMMNARDEILSEMANIEVPGQFQDEVDRERDGMRGEINDLAQKIQKEGAGNLNYMNDFRNLRNKYNQSVSKTGNIGRAAGAKTEVDAMKVAYLEDAINIKHQPAEIAIQRFEEEKQKYFEGLPSQLSKFKGSLPGFTPAFAPPSADSFEVFSKLAAAAKGIDKKAVGDFHFEEGPLDADGESTGYIVVSDSGDAEHNIALNNNASIDSLKQLMERHLLDPNSDVNRNLVYRGLDPSDYLKDADLWADMQRNTSTVDETTYKGQYNMGLNGGKTKVKAPVKVTVPPGKGSLQEETSGMRKLVNSTDTVSIEKAIIDTQNDKELSPAQRTKKITELNLALKYKMELEDGSKDTETTKFKETMDPLIAGDEYWSDKGIYTYADMLDYIEDPEVETDNVLSVVDGLNPTEQAKFNGVTRPNMVAAFKAEYSEYELKEGEAISDGNPTGGGNTLQTPAQLLALRESALLFNKNRFKDDYTKLSNELLTPSVLYGLSVEGDDKTFRKAITDGFSAINYENLQNQGLLSIADEDGYFPIGDTGRANSTSTKGSKPFKKFNDDMANASSKEFTFTGLNDGGITGDSQLVFSVRTKFGEGKFRDHSIAVSLDPEKLSTITEQFLNPDGTYYGLLDKESRFVLDGIRDKNRYGDVATDLKFKMDEAVAAGKGVEIFDEEGTTTVKANALQVLTDSNVRHKRNGNYFGKFLFIDPYDNVNDYAVIINDDNSYSTYKRDSDGNKTLMTFNDYSQKEMAMLAHSKGALGDMAGNEAAWLEAGKYATIKDIADSIPDLQTASNSVIYSDSPRFMQGLNEFADMMELLSPEDRNHPDTIRKAALIFDEYIGKLPISSRQFKLIL